jgi:DNA-binding transcriptional LysR family regulator
LSTIPVDYQLLSIFVAVADEASFSKAAWRLQLGKGTVSRAIARLEDQVGAELLHRNTHKVALSTAGTALYERTAPHLAALVEAVGCLPERAGQPSGLLRLTAPYDLGIILLPQVLPTFSLRYPEVTFDIRLTNARVDLVAEGFDLAIRASVEPLADSSLTVRRLGGGEIHHYASPSYLLRRGEPRELADPRHDWLEHSTARAPAKQRPGRPRGSCNDFLLLRDLLRDGAGVGPLPTSVAAAYLRSGELVRVLPGLRPRERGSFFLLYPSRGQVPRKVIAFRDFLVAHLKTRPLE